MAFLTDELMAMGHDVTLFASGDSVTRAKLQPMHPKALRFDTSLRDGDRAAHADAGASRRTGR